MVENKIKQLGRKVLGRSFAPGSVLYEGYHMGRGRLAAARHNFPGRRMTVIGVTGTNGKTTTCNFIAAILDAAGFKVGLSTTINYWVGNDRRVNENKMTTENPYSLQARLKKMADAGCQFAVIETSSHALAQHRTWGIDYDVAVFTNLTHDHFDYHADFEDYRATKARLFQQLASSKPKPGIPKTMVLNAADPTSEFFAKFPAGQKIYYGLAPNSDPDTVTADIESASAIGSDFRLTHRDIETKVHLSLPGRFNIENALAAAATALSLGIAPIHIKEGLEKTASIPGRMERITVGQDFQVIIDYAHTPDGFAQVLSTLRSVTPARLIVVFGAAGDHDKAKRPILGQIASTHSDLIILTEEDPASEDPIDIINQIRPGISTKFTEGENLLIIPDRKDALAKAFRLARANDTVALLSMGAQTIMVTKTGPTPYNEREVAISLLQSQIK